MSRQKYMLSTGDTERAERLKEVIGALYEINKSVPIIVEGAKDASALRNLGLVGEIITLHTGKNLYDFCTDILERFERVIILLDWDKNGERLTKTLFMYLRGYCEEFSSFREIIKLLCQKEINEIEEIPKLLMRIERYEGSWD